jgi:RNA polymerase sigma-70 factor (ECF subfamily)
MDDGELLGLCRDGDGEAFAVLLERHQAALFSLALRILGNRDDAMDALQDSCIKAWRSIGGLRGTAFRSWMSSIVARTCIDRVRSRKTHVPLEDDEGQVIPLPDPRPGPESETLSRERAAQVEAALLRLSAEHRAVILMRDLTGLSYEEIAEGLHVPVGTVRSRLARARLNLQGDLMRRDPTILESSA